MKLSNETKEVLKNFSTINQNLVIKQGSNISTMSAMKNIIAKSKVTEKFPKEIAIYDLNEFLAALSLFENPELDFKNDGYVVIKEGRSRSQYFFADPGCIITPPEKSIELPGEDVTFELSTDQLDKLLKAAAIYQLADLSVVGGEGVVKVLVRDKKNDTSNDFSIIVGETESTFSFNFKVENIKILPGTYTVVCSQNLSRFTNKNQDLTYFIALEPDSTYE